MDRDRFDEPLVFRALRLLCRPQGITWVEFSAALGVVPRHARRCVETLERLGFRVWRDILDDGRHQLRVTRWPDGLTPPRAAAPAPASRSAIDTPRRAA